MTDSTHQIPVQNLWRLRGRIAELNKRAARLDVPAIAYGETARYCQITTLVGDARRAGREYAEVEITGEPIGLPGYTFLGTIEHGDAENILRAAPEQTIPETYRTAGRACDHCGADRQRTDTYIVGHDDGSFVQVGRSCLKDYIGHIDPKRLAEMMRFIAELTDDDPDRDEWGMGGRGTFTYEPIEFVTAAVAAIRVQGEFKPSAMDDSTASLAGLAFSRSAKDRATLSKRGYEITAEDVDAARTAIAKVIASDETGGYIANLRAAAQMPAVTMRKHLGLLASLPKAAAGVDDRAERAAEREAAKVITDAEKAIAEAAKGDAPDGNGIEVTGTVVSTKWYEGDYGDTLKMLVDLDNGARVFATVPSTIEGDDSDSELVGQRITFTANFTRKERTFSIAKRPRKAAVVQVADEAVA